MDVSFHIVYTPDEGGYNALEPVTGTTSWGADLAEAKAMITEALELYLAETADDGLPDTTGILTGTTTVHTAA